MMKKSIFITVLLTLMFLPLSAGDNGLGLILELNYGSLEGSTFSEDYSADLTEMKTGLKWYRFMTHGWDISLGGTIGFTLTSDRDNISPDYEDGYRQLGLGLFAGVNKRLVSSGPFSAGLAVDFGCTYTARPEGEGFYGYEDYLAYAFHYALPATLDVRCSRHFMVRWRGELVTYDYGLARYREEISGDWKGEYGRIQLGRNCGVDLIFRF